MHLAFSFGRAGNDVLIGSELLPVPLLAQILRSPAIFGSLFLMVLVFATLAKERRNGEASLVIAFSLLFFLITAISPRGFEYMAPLTALAVVTVMSSLTGRARLIIATLLSFGIFWQAYGVYDFLLLNDNLKLSAGRQSAVDAVAALPTSTGSKMVFNCTFAIGPYLLYKRPDLHFIDILDPRLLLGYAPELFRARNDLVNGRVVETYEVLRNVFLADYVLCTDPPLIAKMEKDPRFRRLFPASTPTDDDLINRRVFAYELK